MRRPPEEFSVRETNPHIGHGKVSGDKLTSTYDIVEQMQYLYVHVVKAKDLPGKDLTGTCNPYVLVKCGQYKGVTPRTEQKLNPKWNKVFAFSKDSLQSSVVEITVMDKDLVVDGFVCRVLLNLNEVPKRVPPGSPLAPQWYRLEDQNGYKMKGEIMLGVWFGTQADEAFPEAWPSDAAGISGTDGLANIRSKSYLSPNLWCLRVNVIEVQDLQPSDPGRCPKVCVRGTLGNQVLRTRTSDGQSINPMWNEDLMFVAAEPFDEHLILSAEDIVAPNKNELLGRCVIPLKHVDKRLDHKPVSSRWYSLEKPVNAVEVAKIKKETKWYRLKKAVNAVEVAEIKKDTKSASRIHVRICLEGGYHVFDESALCSSSFQPAAKELWKQRTGVLELGILSAQGLQPMKTKDGRGRTDAYCVAKYGQKWIRTRTITDSFTPKWNEPYSWDVFDPCTVIMIGVFDNCHLSRRDDESAAARDSRIGRVRIRLSTLETDRVYTHWYPLLVLQPNGVKKMGEVQLAVRFTCSSLLNMIYTYSQPRLPKMHDLQPLSVRHLDRLRHDATQIVATRLSRAEPPLRKEIVEYMLDVDSHMWSMRRSEANFSRMIGVLSYLIAVGKWFDQICHWEEPTTAVLIHIQFIILVIHPEIILPTIFLFLFLIVLWRYRWRPRHPPHLDPHLSCADSADPEELDEEFDTFPTSRPLDIVRMRYDRLRRYAARIQMAVGDLATEGERLQSLLSWRDPRATALFVMFCLITAIVVCVTPFKVVVLLVGFYVLRHPCFRQKLPLPLNLRRLPARTDFMF